MSNLVRSRSSRSRKTKSQGARAGHSRLAASSRSRGASRAWNRRGARPIRFRRLRAALTILEKGQDGHHVVAYDPTERDHDTPGRRAQRRSTRGRDEHRVARGRRLLREGDEDLEEVVRTSRRRAVRTEGLSEGDGDRIQIEVGAVKGLQAKRGVKRGAYWMVLLSLLLFWVPVLGPAAAGYIGGRKAGTPLRALFAAAIAVAGAFAALAAIAASTANVPGLLRHIVQNGYTAVLDALPFSNPILEYMFANLGAVMAAGPDSLFLLLAFALAGGAVSEMKLQERMVPTITAKVPGSRVVQPMVQTPARAHGGRSSSEVDGLVAELNDALARAEKERKAFAKMRGGSVAGSEWGQPRRGLFGWRSSRAGAVALSAEGEEEEVRGGLDPAGRKVVTELLASTPPARGERRAKAVKVPAVDFDLPQTIAFVAPTHAAGAEGKGAAHQYRSGKYYHIYGGSVNPVARAKLEKRLRRTHTLHAMRRGTRSFTQMVEVEPVGAHAGGSHTAHAHEDGPSDRPRSLEPAALTAEMHYDALEHLENASFARPKVHAAPAPKAQGEDDLGGLIAHLGEGGEAVVEERGVRDVEFGAGPVFDRRGRQRARIAEDEEPVKPIAPVRPASKPKAMPAVVREAIHSVSHEEPAHGKSAVAKSADRATLTPSQDAKVNRWLKKAIESSAAEEAKAKAKPAARPKAEPEPEAPAKAEAHEKPAAHEDLVPAEHKPAARHPKAKATAPAFEITHGSTEVDAEAEADEAESSAPRKNRSAADILREIKAQKKADKDAEAGEETARLARGAKDEADEIERHARESATLPEVGEIAMAAHEAPTEEAPKAAPKKRSRGDDLEEVKTDAERLGGDLELTLAPIRDEAVEIREIADVHAEAAPSAHAGPSEDAGIPQVGAVAGGVEVTDIVTTATAPEPERDVKPGDVVLAGPSTDVVLADPGEAELSAHDQERIRKRLQEGWNRL